MDIYEAELDWEYDAETKFMVETTSDLRDYYIDLDCVLWVYALDSAELLAVRQCVDDDHARFIAEAFDCVAARNRDRGENWHGYAVDDTGLELDPKHRRPERLPRVHPLA